MVFLRNPDGDAGARSLHLRRLHLRLPHLNPGVEVSWKRGHNQELAGVTLYPCRGLISLMAVFLSIAFLGQIFSIFRLRAALPHQRGALAPGRDRQEHEAVQHRQRRAAQLGRHAAGPQVRHVCAFHILRIFQDLEIRQLVG